MGYWGNVKSVEVRHLTVTSLSFRMTKGDVVLSLVQSWCQQQRWEASLHIISAYCTKKEYCTMWTNLQQSQQIPRPGDARENHNNLKTFFWYEHCMYVSQYLFKFGKSNVTMCSCSSYQTAWNLIWKSFSAGILECSRNYSETNLTL